MAIYKCPTLGDCERANLGEIFSRGPGEDLKCPSCMTLLEIQARGPNRAVIDKRAIIASVAAAIVIVGAAGGFYYKKVKVPAVDVVVLASAPASNVDASLSRATAIDASAPVASANAATDPTSSRAAAYGGIAPTEEDIKQTRREGDSKLTTGDSAGAATASNQAAAKELVKSAIAQMSQGKLDKAEKDLNDALVRDVKQPLVYYNVAILRLKQGRTDDALKQLEASFLNGFKFFDQMDRDPDLDSIRQDPRFVDLEKRYRSAA